MLASYARHAETGEPMPQDLLDRLLAARDLRHGLPDGRIRRLGAGRSGLPRRRGARRPDGERRPRCWPASACRAPSGCATRRRISPMSSRATAIPAGYYSYMWSEVMDADAFAAFEEAGDAFDRERASPQAAGGHATSCRPAAPAGGRRALHRDLPRRRDAGGRGAAEGAAVGSQLARSRGQPARARVLRCRGCGSRRRLSPRGSPRDGGGFRRDPRRTRDVRRPLLTRGPCG